MSKKLYRKIKKVPLYPCRLGVLVCKSYKEVNKFLLSQGMPEEFDFSEYVGSTITRGVVKEKGKELFCIYIVLNPKEEGFTHGLISHEVRHATNAILEHIGQRLDPNNDEAEAYLSGWVADMVYNVLNLGGNIRKLKIV